MEHELRWLLISMNWPLFLPAWWRCDELRALVVHFVVVMGVTFLVASGVFLVRFGVLNDRGNASICEVVVGGRQETKSNSVGWYMCESN